MGRDDVDMDPETSVRDRTGQDSLFFKRESSTNSLLVHVCPSTGWFLFCCLNVPPWLSVFTGWFLFASEIPVMDVCIYWFGAFLRVDCLTMAQCIYWVG